mgnify:CR=1 FL=1
MSDEAFDAARFVEMAATLMGIDLGPDRRAGVIANFESFIALHDRVRGEAPDPPNPADPLGLFRP